MCVAGMELEPERESGLKRGEGGCELVSDDVRMCMCGCSAGMLHDVVRVGAAGKLSGDTSRVGRGSRGECKGVAGASDAIDIHT